MANDKADLRNIDTVREGDPINGRYQVPGSWAILCIGDRAHGRLWLETADGTRLISMSHQLRDAVSCLPKAGSREAIANWIRERCPARNSG